VASATEINPNAVNAIAKSCATIFFMGHL
jgi:hypothetical protein